MKKAIFVVCAALLTGCLFPSDPHADSLTTTKPNRSDIIGTYVVDKVYLPSELSDRKLDISIDLRADGTFSATNVPSWTTDATKANFFPTLLSGDGKWELRIVGSVNPGGVVWGVELQDPTEQKPDAQRMDSASCTGEKAPYGLIFTLGDPDEGNAILLKRKAP